VIADTTHTHTHTHARARAHTHTTHQAKLDMEVEGIILLRCLDDDKVFVLQTERFQQV
jgi:hypothetical protein